MSACGRCEAVPAIPDGGRLSLAAPLGHTRKRLHAFLRARGLAVDDSVDDVMTVDLPGGLLHSLAVELVGGFSRSELNDTRCLLLPPDVSPALSDLGRTLSLSSLVARSQGGWLIEMMQERRLTAFFQPIVLTANPAEVHGHECLLRGCERDGSIVSAGEILRVARDADMLFTLDRAARLEAIRNVVEKRPSGQIFINFAPTAIYDPAFCLRTTVSAVEESGLPAERFVFEVNAADRIADLDHLAGIVRFYRQRGFRIALDDLGAGYGSLDLLARLQPDYVKIDLGLVRGVDQDPFRARVLDRLLDLARDLRLLTLVEGIETEAEWNWARDHGADFSQGFLFARPAALPPPVHLPGSPAR